ncbi:hypothetical protein [Arthrobacter sp. RCC_34]|uniref:hypothetical protein n=1 Tax=Arthrobacter sp. RCC_34 TaxID=3239230 RepID=UPI0035248981
MTSTTKVEDPMVWPDFGQHEASGQFRAGPNLVLVEDPGDQSWTITGGVSGSGDLKPLPSERLVP